MADSALQFVLCSSYSAVENLTQLLDRSLETAIAGHRSNCQVAIGNSSNVIEADNTTFYPSNLLNGIRFCLLNMTTMLPRRSIASLRTTRHTTQRSIDDTTLIKVTV